MQDVRDASAVAPVGGPGPWSDVAPNYFAIPFGLIGLAAAWKTASVTLRGPGWVSPVLLVAAATAWLAVCAAYLVKTARRADAVRADLRSPVLNPFWVFLPVCVALLGAGLLPYARLTAEVIVVIGIVGAIGYGAWWTAGLALGGGLSFGQVHSGYLLPVAVAGIETAGAAAAAGWMPLARLCFGVGLLGWAGFGALSLARLVLAPPPAPALMPTLAIDAAVAAAAGVAYFNVYGGNLNTLTYAIAGYGLVMAAVQVRLLPRYVRLPFTPGIWVFVFATAVTATDVLRWMHALSAEPAWPAWAVLAAVTALIAWITIRTAIALVTANSGRGRRSHT